MKRKIAWHKECFQNWERNVDCDEKEVARLATTLQNNKTALAHYAAQIQRAERDGKEEFDRERYMKTKN